MAELKAFKSLFRRVSAFGCSLITFTEAALGADVNVPTIDGDQVKVRIAPGTSNVMTSANSYNTPTSSHSMRRYTSLYFFIFNIFITKFNLCI
mgnify:CR=1 FL=1